MRELLEFRLAGRWTSLLVVQATAISIASLLISVGFVSLELPSRAVLVAGLFLLAAVWFEGRRMETADRSEKREALHAALPITRHDQALARVLEPLPFLLLTALMVSLAFVGFGRFSAESPSEFEVWSGDLWLFLGVASCFLVFEMLQQVMLELQKSLRDRGIGWVFWIAAAVFAGVPGIVVGYVLGRGKLVPFIFHLTLGRPAAIGLALLLAALLAVLSVRFFRRRDIMLDCS